MAVVGDLYNGAAAGRRGQRPDLTPLRPAIVVVRDVRRSLEVPGARFRTVAAS